MFWEHFSQSACAAFLRASSSRCAGYTRRHEVIVGCQGDGWIGIPWPSPLPCFGVNTL